jgi:hypothetical protein
MDEIYEQIIKEELEKAQQLMSGDEKEREKIFEKKMSEMKHEKEIKK